MWRYYDKLTFWLDTLSERDWFILLACVCIAGLMCMRGFGSRKNY
jgi:hypothetical protein